MKILNAQQTRLADAFTVKNEPIKSIDLMERAAQVFIRWFKLKFDDNKKVLLIAGSGNNGGDALAIARLLSTNSYHPKVLLALPESTGSVDYQINLKRLPSQIEMVDKVQGDSDVIIDGLFGSGLTRDVTGELATLIDSINSSGKQIVSIDIASGLSYDGIATEGAIIKPNYTVSFQLPKLAFMFSENSQFVGKYVIVNIGLNRGFIADQNSPYKSITGQEIKKSIKPRELFAHKGNFGHALLIGGSYGKIGAIILASKACIRSGSGLVTSLLPSCGYDIMQSSVPEVMCLINGEKHLEPLKIEDVNDFTSVGIGPGLGKSKGTLSLLGDVLKTYKRPMVFDADALNLLTENSELLQHLPENSILTPHVGEFHRMVGITRNSLDRLKEQRKFSRKHKVIVVLKGANTSITNVDGNVWFNPTGNSGMATGGSGDVLTGIITSLLAQGYLPLESAQIGVFLHGRAGDIAKNDVGEHSLIASDITQRISDAFISII